MALKVIALAMNPHVCPLQRSGADFLTMACTIAAHLGLIEY